MKTDDKQSRDGRKRPGEGVERASRSGLAAVFLGLVAAAVWHAGTRGAMADASPSDPPAAVPKPVEQTECPVMIGNQIDPGIFTTYRGKKVYFCCPSCKSAFENAPEKYLHRLPQFASAAAPAGQPGEGQDDRVGPAAGFSAVRLIEPMGALTLSLVAATVCLGLLRRVRRLKPPLLLRVHKTCGVSALVAGAVHAALVLVAH